MSAPDFLPRDALGEVFGHLRDMGFRCVGPSVADGVIRYTDIAGPDQLPTGYRDSQAPGEYRLEQTGSPRSFAWANGPQAIKPMTFAPREVLWRVERGSGGIGFFAAQPPDEALALIGVRSCDLAALKLQKQLFGRAPPDPHFAARTAQLFLLAVHCATPSANCFCAATGDGPAADDGYDVAMHELDDGFLVAAGSARGRELLDRLPLEDAGEQRRAQVATEQVAAAKQARGLPAVSLAGRLSECLDHPAWQSVAERCLSCGSCTAVCPTCFCHAQHDENATDGQSAVHVREWDTCFSDGHSELHGTQVRGDTRLRYRQWLTHKFDTWHAQFGRGGCVGCGRCITWCPVGIDVTEVLHELCDT